MSGRHHLPSTPSRPVLRAGVLATAAVTGPLAVAGTAVAAPAASSSTWDELAMCESTQNWEADTGNGFKGGLQFTDSTWEEFGGEQYAEAADEASRSEQIAVARKVQDEQGWNAWPTCSQELGLQ
ncbi:transglycosylase family protein [Actinomycetospora cinnamomea]|uniref:Transglycosylase-like protein with SLT domain n=1 Tax=Actinomycetospora cinnamomea TaxID=663609 RepID=A0A2U1F6C3_9PSEU|nr:transglycosylase family protein [Actinomycetospora cinnamomea]PVZ07731.1 transglycosylase-like protein with SLT domain [Actinomycetospora cinnamomea]